MMSAEVPLKFRYCACISLAGIGGRGAEREIPLLTLSLVFNSLPWDENKPCRPVVLLYAGTSGSVY